MKTCTECKKPIAKNHTAFFSCLQDKNSDWYTVGPFCLPCAPTLDGAPEVLEAHKKARLARRGIA